jgi:D-alanyl-D-alanine carboxypeptidase
MRRTAAAGHCQGKTGTLTGASNLVGYCQTTGGHVIAFAIFNDAISTTAAHIFQDHMTISIASSQISSAELARLRSRNP